MRNTVYYGIKPIVPTVVRRAVRRWFAQRRRRETSAIWPVLPGSELRPEGWPGWPDGKKFAFVLTHDVEGQSGLDKSRQLMEVEMKHGFRSSFNFIPEGEYKVSKEFREELVRNGFEVGVHDLQHDGKLYGSRDVFASKAAKINGYLKEWGAVGFRAGFMFHNLEWLQDLEITYDASTFDVDPFEPQPDGVGTIFPFWKEGRNGRGFVELPYTLPQDSTLYLLFGEKTADVWKRKLDWVTSHEGMVLVNVHPDYLRFPGEPASHSTFSVELYEELLRYARQKGGQSMWAPLPKELATWYLKAKPALAPSRVATASAVAATPGVKMPVLQGHVGVVLYSYYLSDPRPRRETESLVQAGMKADVICLRKDKSEPVFETVNGVNIHRVSLQHQRGGQLGYFLRYGYFFLSAFWRLTVWSWRKELKLVHVHNMPDFLVFTALVPRLKRAKVILDLHDPMPELFCGIYAANKGHFLYRLLCQIERWSIAFADRVLTPNISFKNLFVSRSGQADKIEIVMNSPQPATFDAAKYPPDTKTKRPFTMMYHGLLVERHGLDLAIDAMAGLKEKCPPMALEIYGDHTPYVDKIKQQIDSLKMESMVHLKGYRKQPEIARAIADIDLGVIPNRLIDFTNINFPTRIFEYLAMNKPVLVPRTRGICDYFADDEILYFEAGNIEDLAKKMAWACEHPAELKTMMERGREVYRRNCWPTQEKKFIELAGSLVDRARSPHFNGQYAHYQRG